MGVKKNFEGDRKREWEVEKWTTKERKNYRKGAREIYMKEE